MASSHTVKPATAGTVNGLTKNVSIGNRDNRHHKDVDDFVQAGEAAKRALLHCLRQHIRETRLYQIELETIGVALSRDLIETGEAVKMLVDLDGCACLEKQVTA